MTVFARFGLALAPLLLAGCGGNSDNQSGSEADDVESAAPVEESATSDVVTTDAMASAPPAVFMRCRSCHSAEPGKNGIGPSLHGIVGRQAASIEGFNYSPALKQSGLVWDRATLDTFLTSPMKMVPGTRMVIGIPNVEAREELIDYLETLK